MPEQKTEKRNTKTMKVRLTLVEELLGTASANPDLFAEFIASKAPEPWETTEEEVAALPGVDEVIEKTTTVFSRMAVECPVCDDAGFVNVADGSPGPQPRTEPCGNCGGAGNIERPCLWDYQIKGFFKDACGMLRRAPGTKSRKLSAYKKVIDGLIFVTPRQIALQYDGELGHCQRPLRAQTAQGERVALARSETVPAGSIIEFEVTALDGKLLDLVCEWLDYGEMRGLGQWRNSGKGCFIWSIADWCGTGGTRISD